MSLTSGTSCKLAALHVENPAMISSAIPILHNKKQYIAFQPIRKGEGKQVSLTSKDKSPVERA
jgi:hypothetical protein